MFLNLSYKISHRLTQYIWKVFFCFRHISLRAICPIIMYWILGNSLRDDVPPCYTLWVSCLKLQQFRSFKAEFGTNKLPKPTRMWNTFLLLQVLRKIGRWQTFWLGYRPTNSPLIHWILNFSLLFLYATVFFLSCLILIVHCVSKY